MPRRCCTGFSAEITAKTASFTGLPKYNAYGLPYTYTVREAKVETKAGSEYAAATEKQTENGNQYLVTADGYRYLQKTVTGGQRQCDGAEYSGGQRAGRHPQDVSRRPAGRHDE
jgi:hypothetical protein